MSIAQTLVRASEARDPSQHGHSSRVAAMCELVAERLGWDEREVDLVRLGATLHDVGKLRVSTSVLRKAGPLTEHELLEIRTHPEEGARMISLVRELRAAVPGVLFHHERWDGLGYPFGCEGEAIPAEARIIAVVDSFDAMTSMRPYRGPMTGCDAVDELRRCAGYQFDPDVVDVFSTAWEDGLFEPMRVPLRETA